MGMTIADASEMWLEVQMSRIRPKSITVYRSCLNNHILPDLAGVEVEEATTTLISKAFVNWRMSVNEPTLFQIKKVLSCMFSFLIEEGIVTKNPALRIYVDTSLPDVDVLTHDQVVLLLDKAKDCWFYPHLILLTNAGLRMSELLGLQWKDIDFSRKNIAIRRGYYDGKAHPTKTKSSNRVIKVAEFAINVLQEHKSRAEENLPGCEWVFPNRNKKPVSHQCVARAIKKFLKVIGLPLVKPHSFRHEHATYLLENGCSLKAIMKRFGWSSPTMLLTRYAHITERENDKINNCLEKAHIKSAENEKETSEHSSLIPVNFSEASQASFTG